MKTRYELFLENGVWHILDKIQDIFINRFGYVTDDGFLTLAEANATIKHLENKS